MNLYNCYRQIKTSFHRLLAVTLAIAIAYLCGILIFTGVGFLFAKIIHLAGFSYCDALLRIPLGASFLFLAIFGIGVTVFIIFMLLAILLIYFKFRELKS